VPSNSPAFLIKTYLEWVAPSLTLTEDRFAVESQAGDQIPFHLEQAEDATAIVLDSPLSEFEWYYLRYPEYCPAELWIDEPLELVRPFQTGLPFTKQSDTAEVWTLSHRREVIDVWSDSGSCSKQIEADVMRFEFVSSASLATWDPLVRVETLVDGERWAISPPGEPDTSAAHDFGFFPSPITGIHRPTVLFSRCGASDPSDDNGLPPGKHEVEFRFHVYGLSEPLPPVRTTVEMGCSDTADETSRAQSDAGGYDEISRTQSDAGGCAVRSSDRVASLPAVALLLLTVFLIAVRKPANPWTERPTRSTAPVPDPRVPAHVA